MYTSRANKNNKEIKNCLLQSCHASSQLLSVAVVILFCPVVPATEKSIEAAPVDQKFNKSEKKKGKSSTKIEKRDGKIVLLEPITIFHDEKNLSLILPSIEQSRQKLNSVPGGTTVIDGNRLKEGANFTITDTLSYSPGVYIGDSQASVAGGSRISIRGSDINSAFIPIRGIKFLRNGMPFTNANGFTDTESLNLNSIRHIEIYRGANALEYGGSNLGGAINFITPTGYTADPLKIGMVMGSDGYYNPSVSGGGVFDNGWDGFASFSYLTFDGNRNNSGQELFYGYGNLGYRWNKNHETRLHLDIQDINFLIPFGLTKQQLKDDPRQSIASSEERPSGFRTYRVDLQHTVTLNAGNRLDFGGYYFSKNNLYNFQRVGYFYDLWQDAGLSLRHQIKNELFGLKHSLTWGVLTQWLWIKDKEYNPTEDRKGILRSDEEDLWTNVEAYIQDNIHLSDHLTIVLGAQINYRRIEIERHLPELASGSPNPAHQDFFNFNPKLGFVWQAWPKVQFFGNVSRSAEPPPINDYVDILQVPKLVSQTATTLEIGTRGGDQRFKWDLAIYHSWLEHELLTIPAPPTFVNFQTSNAQHTEHTGIELGLESTIPLNMIANDQLRLRGSYTWSRYQFSNDSQLGNNRLPGIPEHYGRFEVLYQNPSGFYIGPNVTIASSNWGDFANTLSADSYALLGARMGWKAHKHWHFYIDARNLTDESYAASVFVTGDSRVVDEFSRGNFLFNPGSTRMLFAGFEYRY